MIILAEEAPHSSTVDASVQLHDLDSQAVFDVDGMQSALIPELYCNATTFEDQVLVLPVVLVVCVESGLLCFMS